MMQYFAQKTRLLQQKFFFALSAIGLFFTFPVFVFGAPGDLDPSFGSGGKVASGFGWMGASDVAIQRDGKIVAAGFISPFPSYQIAVVRYNPNGSFDTSFGNGGKVFTSVGQFTSGNALEIQADGRIVVAGESCVFGPVCDSVVVRYHADGSLDTSFNGSGILIVDFGNDNGAHDLDIQPDGKIVVVGRSGVPGNNNYAFAAARLNANGTLDASFDGDGKVITSFGHGAAHSVALQPDGKIVTAGSRFFNSTDFALVRYNTDGSLDNSFDGDGIVVTAVSNGGDIIGGIALQTDGKIVAAGGTSNFAAIARYNTNGSLDMTFDSDGIALTDIGVYDFFTSIVIQANGKIVAGGYNYEHAVARYNPNGSLDMTFGGDGIVSTNFNDLGFGEGYGGIGGLAIQSDGKIVTAGNWGFDGEFSVFVLARYNGDSVVTNRRLYDFDGDGRADVSLFRPTNGTWYLNRSQAGISATQFGFSTDKITPADFDGDGKTDIAVYRNGIWYWLNSSNGNFNAVQFGLADDVPVPADYTGDGRAELAVYRGGYWYIYNLSNDQFSFTQFGNSTDKSVVGDYDGDSRADYAVYRDGTWYLNRSTQGFAAIQFGLPTDKLVPADYDGDGKIDLAVFRPSTATWYINRSQLGFTSAQFGLSTDIPVPADYDGDGCADIAVYRNDTWFIQRSTAGFTGVQFGGVGDQPIPNAFVR